MQYTENDLARIAKRENNAKRGYLVVDPLQGKHMAVEPTKALKLFEALAMKIADKYVSENLLVVGFSETATAIGAQVAITLGAEYIQTTRETIKDVEYLFFSETHSHATEQKLVKDDIDKIFSEIDRIVFVEDEVTTGNTIMNIIGLLNDTYSKTIHYTILSILNGMDKEAVEKCLREKIDLYYLVKTDHSNYEQKVSVYELDGTYVSADSKLNENFTMLEVQGYMNARRLIMGEQYRSACENMSNMLMQKLDFNTNESILIIGTEEFMYPALFFGSKLEGLGCDVQCHSTTRSPIGVSKDAAYPLHVRYELQSLYEENRRTFIYDIDKYDKVVIVTDSKLEKTDLLNSLLNAVQLNNSEIYVVRWY